MVYIPDSCYHTTCKLHVALHGCLSDPEEFASYNFYNEFAANNDLIVLYPDSRCHNINGSVDEGTWLTKDGVYPETYMAMIDRLTVPGGNDVKCQTEGSKSHG